MSVNFIRRNSDGSFGPEGVFRSVSRPLFGHCFGAIPAPCGGLLFCFDEVALRVTASLEILFGKYVEKISPEPP
jgi:peptide methionine sulfoxide reductase MsrB